MGLRDLLSTRNPTQKSEVKTSDKNTSNIFNQEQQLEKSIPNVNQQEELPRKSFNATNTVYPFHDEKATSVPPPLSIDASISTDPQKPIVAVKEEKIISGNLITEDLKRDDKKVVESVGTKEESREKEETTDEGEKRSSMERTCDWRNCDMRNSSWQPCEFFGEKQKLGSGVSLTKLAEIINTSMKEAVEAITKQCRMQQEEERISSLEIEKRRNKEDETCYDKNICKEKARVKNKHENRSHVIQEISNNRQISTRPRENIYNVNRRDIQTYNAIQKHPKKNHEVENLKIDKKKENLRENSRDKKQQKLMNNVKTDNRRMTGNVNIYICSETVENAQTKEKEKSKSCSKTISETTTEESSVPSSKLETNIQNKRKKSQDSQNFLNDIKEIDSETSDVIPSPTNPNYLPPKFDYDFIENDIHSRENILARNTESSFLEKDSESIQMSNLSDQTFDRRDLFVLSSDTTYPLPNVTSNSMEIGEWSWRSTYSETNSNICLSDNDYSKYQRVWKNDTRQISADKNDNDRWLSRRVCVDRKSCLEAESDWQLKSICTNARYDSFDSITNSSCTCIAASDRGEEDELSENTRTNSKCCCKEEKNFAGGSSDRKVFNNYRIKRKSLKAQRENAGKQWSVCSCIAEEEEGREDCFASEKDEKKAEELIIGEKLREDGKGVIELSKGENERKEKLEVHETPIVEEEKKEELVNELSRTSRKRVSAKDEEKLRKELSRNELNEDDNNERNKQAVDNDGEGKIDTGNLEGEQNKHRESNETKRVKRNSRVIKDDASKQSVDLRESKIKTQLRNSILKQRAQLKASAKRISDKTIPTSPKKPVVAKNVVKNHDKIPQKIVEPRTPISERRHDSKLNKAVEEKTGEENKDANVSEEKNGKEEEDEKKVKGNSVKDKLKDSLLCKTLKKAMDTIKRRSARSKQHAESDKIVEQTPRDADVNKKYNNNILKMKKDELPAQINGDTKGKIDAKDGTVVLKKEISGNGKINKKRDSLKRSMSTKDERIRKKDISKTATNAETPESSAQVKDERSMEQDQIKLAYDKNRERILKSKLLTIIEKRRASVSAAEKSKEPLSTEKRECVSKEKEEPDSKEKEEPDSKEKEEPDFKEKEEPDSKEKREPDSKERREPETIPEELTAEMEKSETPLKRTEAEEAKNLKETLPEQTASKPRDSIIVKVPTAEDKTISRKANGEKHLVCGAQNGETVCTQYVERESSETRFNRQASIKKFTQCGTTEFPEPTKEIQTCRCTNSPSFHRCKKSSTYPRSCLKTNSNFCQTNIEKPVLPIHTIPQTWKNCTCKKSQAPNYREPSNDRSFTNKISKPRTNCTCNMYDADNDRRRKRSMFCLYCDKPREKCVCRAPIQRCTYCELSLDLCRCHDEEIFHDIRPVFIEPDNDRSMHVTAWKPRKDVRRYFSRKPEDIPSKYKDDRRYEEKPKPHGSDDLPYQRLRVFSDVMSELQQKISETACCRRCKKIPCCCTVNVERERERDARRTRQFVSSKLWKDGSAEGNRGKSSRKYESKVSRDGSERVVIMPVCCGCRTMPCRCINKGNQMIVRPKCYYCNGKPCV